MYNKLVLIAFACILTFQDVHVSAQAQTRDEIIKRYTPQLQEQAAKFLQTFQSSSKELALITQDIKNNTVIATGIVEAQIANCKNGIALAKKQAAAKPKALTCIATQETASASLSSAAVAQSCPGPTLTEVSKVSQGYQSLSTVASLTVNACVRINPLPKLQDEELLKCITEKIIDLDQQFFNVERDYEGARSAVLNGHIQCLTTATNPIVQKVNAINFQVTLCLSLS